VLKSDSFLESLCQNVPNMSTSFRLNNLPPEFAVSNADYPLQYNLPFTNSSSFDALYLSDLPDFQFVNRSINSITAHLSGPSLAVLMGPSGVGKTRTVMEILKQRYGVYLDLSQGYMKPFFDYILTMPPYTARASPAAKRLEAMWQSIYVARLIYLLVMFRSNVIVNNAQGAEMFLRYQLTLEFTSDCMNFAVQKLWALSLPAVLQLITCLKQKLQVFVEMKLLLAVDEVQVAGNYGSFISSKPNIVRSFFSPLCSYHINQYAMIISGTSLSLYLLQDNIASAINKPGADVAVFHSFPYFTPQDVLNHTVALFKPRYLRTEILSQPAPSICNFFSISSLMNGSEDEDQDEEMQQSEVNNIEPLTDAEIQLLQHKLRDVMYLYQGRARFYYGLLSDIVNEHKPFWHAVASNAHQLVNMSTSNKSLARKWHELLDDNQPRSHTVWLRPMARQLLVKAVCFSYDNMSIAMRNVTLPPPPQVLYQLTPSKQHQESSVQLSEDLVSLALTLISMKNKEYELSICEPLVVESGIRAHAILNQTTALMQTAQSMCQAPPSLGAIDHGRYLDVLSGLFLMFGSISQGENIRKWIVSLGESASETNINNDLLAALPDWADNHFKVPVKMCDNREGSSMLHHAFEGRNSAVWLPPTNFAIKPDVIYVQTPDLPESKNGFVIMCANKYTNESKVNQTTRAANYETLNLQLLNSSDDEQVGMCVCACVRVCVRACVCVCVCACVRS
jgi:hypothetical protein